MRRAHVARTKRELCRLPGARRAHVHDDQRRCRDGRRAFALLCKRELPSASDERARGCCGDHETGAHHHLPEQDRSRASVAGAGAVRPNPGVHQGHGCRARTRDPHLGPARAQPRRHSGRADESADPEARLCLGPSDDHHPLVRRQQAGVLCGQPQGRRCWRLDRARRAQARRRDRGAPRNCFQGLCRQDRVRADLLADRDPARGAERAQVRRPRRAHRRGHDY
eukprot:Amastigsp_a134_413.p4 type:complete len:224 gc:universal Amastigsp_a134_413:448-1119(+)